MTVGSMRWRCEWEAISPNDTLLSLVAATPSREALADRAASCRWIMLEERLETAPTIHYPALTERQSG